SDITIENILKNKKIFDFDFEISRYDKLNIKLASYFDDEYPKILKQIPDPPIIIFYKGNFNVTKTIGVVGSRNCSEYGISVTRDFCNYFINNNIITVSGGAVGVDSISHEVSVNNHFPTISVMGAGLDIIYPYKNKNLFQNIVDNNGVIVSEFPLGVQALPQNFVMRNRIIAGLSSGILIVEAGLKSGTMTTAEFAVNQNKNVFVVPGSIYSPFSDGANYLIKNGAIFVTNPQEIDEMIWGINNNHKLIIDKNKKETEENKIDIFWMNENEKNIFNTISYKPKNIENIIIESGLDVKKINSILIFFEIKGLIKNVGGMNYIKNK
ncbi:MAG: DNA-processing protein DprA, partial [Patescibacteria group bacterium]